MFVVQETGDTFRVFGQREASVKREGSARHATGKGAQKIITRRASLVLYARFALAFARLKNAKKKTPILQAARTVEQNWYTFFARK